MLKEILYTGLGGAFLLKERVDEEIKRLEEKGKLRKEDAEQFFNDLKSRGKDEEAQAKEKLKELLREVIDEMGLATKADIQALKAK
jgi:polyhydroxyalkanoate synthesis regulator phasin